MIQSPQVVQVTRDGVVHEAEVAWRLDGRHWVVELRCTEFDLVDAREDDAFEALCRVRDQLELHGWRIGVAGARADVWPSGMARDQGGGLRVYQIVSHSTNGLVTTFEAVDPATVVTVAEQQAEIDRLYPGLRGV